MLSTEVNVKAAHFGAAVLKRKPPGGGGRAKQKRNLAFSEGKSGWNWLKFLQKTPDPLAHHFHFDSLPRPSGTKSKHAKALCLGWEVAMFCEAAKREWQGGTLTGPWVRGLQTAVSRYRELRQSRLPSLTPAEADQIPKAVQSGLPSLTTVGMICRWVLFTCHSVNLLLSFSASQNVATSTSSTSKFHINTFQYNVGGAVMLNAITYSQDCLVISLQLEQ